MADCLVPAVDEIYLILISEQQQDLHCLFATSASTPAVTQEPMQPRSRLFQKRLALNCAASHLIKLSFACDSFSL